MKIISLFDKDMRRSEFIEKSIITYFGLIASPSLFASCKKHILELPPTNFNGKVIIVGAGAAGIYAGFLLNQQGIDFEILEATDRIGGRLGKLENFADYPLDTGAQWLHGKKSVIGDLVKSSNTKITRDNTELHYWLNDEITKELPVNIERKLQPSSEYEDISFQQFATNEGLSNYKDIVEAIAGDYGADSNDISIKWTAFEEQRWSSGTSDYKFERTYYDLIFSSYAEHIMSKIKLDAPVKNIDYTDNLIKLTDHQNNLYYGDKVLVTVPVTILQDGDIEFTPSLPVPQQKAFNAIGMGAGMKVFLKFKTKFYHENIFGGKICAAYADESIGKSGIDHILLAFVMGEQALMLGDLNNDEERVNKLLEELDTLYDRQATENFIEAHVEDWTAKPYIKGAYSYSKIGIGNARSIASKPINNKIYFAGEAMNNEGHHATVHGAIESRFSAIKSIIS